MPQQSDWRYCQNCHAMFYDGFGNKGNCQVGGRGHTAQGLNFTLPYGEPSTDTAQTNWRFCNKCYLMFYNGYSDKGSCAAGSGHSAQGIVFALPHSFPSSASAQGDWRYCQKCHAMFYDGYADKGACAAGGGHVAQGLNFSLPFSKGEGTGATRPSFTAAWSAFTKVNVPVKDVGTIIGGKVKQNTDSEIFENACPIRMSYVLNKTTVKIPFIPGETVSGAVAGEWYMFHVNKMMSFLEDKFGPADKTVTSSPKESDFAGLRGILVVKGHGRDNAKGHVTLWNGSVCVDSCHLAHDPDNGRFVPEKASLWKLP